MTFGICHQIPCLRIGGGVGEGAGVRRLLVFLSLILMVGSLGAAPKERVWDQEVAKAKIAKVLEVEGTRKQPWNTIPWHSDPKAAVAEARGSRKPLLVFMFSKEAGPPLEPCCPPGRLIRALSLSDSEVQKKIIGSFVPLKLIYTEGKGFGVKWLVLNGWETKFQFAAGDGCAGCAILNADLNMEFANSGSALVGELFESVAYDPKKFSTMLSRGYQRWKEDGIMGREGGLSMRERQQEVDRYRRGVVFEVEKEGEMRLPPIGYSLAKAMELFRMAGARKE